MLNYRKLWAVLIMSVILFSAALSQAGVSLMAGIKWIPARYTVPAQAQSHPDENTLATTNYPGVRENALLGSWYNIDLNPYVGLGLFEKLYFILGLDIGWYKHSNNYEPHVASGTAAYQSYTQFGFNIGIKYYFSRPTKGNITPYIYADFYKYFAAIGDDHIGAELQPEVVFNAAFSSPVGFNLAFGIEYNFSDGFSIGAEILGFRYEHQGADFIDENLVTHDVSRNLITLYVGITMNFRFLGTKAKGTTLIREPDRYKDLDRYKGRTRDRYKDLDRPKDSTRDRYKDLDRPKDSTRDRYKEKGRDKYEDRSRERERSRDHELLRKRDRYSSDKP